LLSKKIGILGAVFPPSWRAPGDWGKVAQEREPAPLSYTIMGSSVLLVVTYDPRKRASSALGGDALRSTSLECVMENTWLLAQGLGIVFHAGSVFGWDLWWAR
jgi:hypothetical protein